MLNLFNDLFEIILTDKTLTTWKEENEKLKEENKNENENKDDDYDYENENEDDYENKNENEDEDDDNTMDQNKKNELIKGKNDLLDEIID